MGNSFSRGGFITLKGHYQVAAVRFLPCGELVSAGDTSVRVWLPETGKAEKVLHFQNSAETLSCSPDGRHFAVGVADGLIFVFEAKTRQQVAHWQAHADCKQGPLLHFFADSTYLLSAAGNCCKIWSSRTATLINRWDTTLITSISISPDCSTLAVGSSTGIVTLHSLPGGAAVRRLHAHRSEVWALAFSPDRSLLVTASGDDPDGLKMWSAVGELIQVLNGHVSLVLDCTFSRDSLQLVTCGFDRTVRLWHRPQGTVQAMWTCENVLSGHTDAVLTCAFAPGNAAVGGVVASGSRDGTARAWRLADVPPLSAADAAYYGVR